MSAAAWTALVLGWLASIALVWAVVRGGTLPRSSRTPKDKPTRPDADADETAGLDRRSHAVRLDELSQRLDVLRTALDELREDTNVRFLKREKRDQRERAAAAPSPSADPDAEELAADPRQLDFLRPSATPRLPHNGRGRLVRR